ncbi:MAG: two pore domain potassium channel family protein [Planctomycetes bacterium]|nr:two pore domain potassium channel family protein [Planctomycetota bacterium]
MCDYGRSTWRVLISFTVLAMGFAVAYTLLPESVVAIWAEQPGQRLGFGYSLYFSIVTMTTLGFGDVYAAPSSAVGQFLLSLQVVLGYLLLGTLVTRFAMLFSAGGPSASFYRKKVDGQDSP